MKWQALLGLCAVVIGGCGPRQSGPTMLEPKSQSYWTDVPVPREFNRDERKSTYSSAAGRREVDDVYVGPDSCLAVRNFYYHNMPVAGWQPLPEGAEKFENEVYTLKYRKGDERAEIRIERVPAPIMGRRTQIRAHVGKAQDYTSSR